MLWSLNFEYEDEESEDWYCIEGGHANYSRYDGRRASKKKKKPSYNSRVTAIRKRIPPTRVRYKFCSVADLCDWQVTPARAFSMSMKSADTVEGMAECFVMDTIANENN